MLISGNEPLKNYFTGLAEHTFEARLGVADPPLVDYISDLLVRFIHNDLIFRLRDPQGRPLTEVVAMLSEASQRIGSAKREAHRHIGDYTLFWSGMYPEALAARQSPNRPDYLLDYREQGKRAYWIASTIDIDEEPEVAPGEVLERLSCQFELCTYGLREIRSEWERRDDGDAPRPYLIN
ncbi:MAG TPA: hypothetical protein VIY86_15145 [Pirellulaceae bacterium]